MVSCIVLKKNSNETQASHIFFFTLLVMLGNYEPTCIGNNVNHCEIFIVELS